MQEIPCYTFCCYEVNVCVLHLRGLFTFVSMVTVVLVSIVTVGYINNVFRLVPW